MKIVNGQYTQPGSVRLRQRDSMRWMSILGCIYEFELKVNWISTLFVSHTDTHTHTRKRSVARNKFCLSPLMTYRHCWRLACTNKGDHFASICARIECFPRTIFFCFFLIMIIRGGCTQMARWNHFRSTCNWVLHASNDAFGNTLWCFERSPDCKRFLQICVRDESIVVAMMNDDKCEAIRVHCCLRYSCCPDWHVEQPIGVLYQKR